MIKAFDFSFCALTSAAGCVAETTLWGIKLILACVTFTSCGEQSPHDASRTSVTGQDGSASARIDLERVRRTTGLNVTSIRTTRSRVDLTVAVEAPPGNPDTEFRSFATVAEQLWDRAAKGSQAETVAITTLHAAAPNGVLGRNTYFYYRSERSDLKAIETER